MLRSTKESKTVKPKSNVSQKAKDEKPKPKKVTTKSKAVQTAEKEKIKIEADDLISTAGPSENYWQVVAEKRRIALKETLEENKRLSEEKEELAQRVEQLEEENRMCKEMLNETKALVEVLQDMIGDDRSGINNSLEDSLL
ncbi:Geminin [Ooceraea biroi]|nr:Geminin [Ooceraea biroi]